MEIEKINIYSLPYVLIPERENLPKNGGIYFVLSENNGIEYIGKAGNLNRRWRKHECCIDLDSPKTCRVAWIEISSEDERTEYEKQLIRKFNPKLNTNYIIQPPRQSSFMNDETDFSDMISISEAARIREVSHTAIQDLIKRGKFTVREIGGRKLLSRKEVENYKPETGGRPPKFKDKK